MGSLDWDNTLCEGCSARLSVWADSLYGRCGRCWHPFPVAFQWVQEAAMLRKQEENEKAERARQHIEQVLRIQHGASSASLLLTYIQAERSAGKDISRLELIAFLRSRTGMTWLQCRELVDEFLAENLTPTIPAERNRLWEIAQRMH
jgi:hypothetical protein